MNVRAGEAFYLPSIENSCDNLVSTGFIGPKLKIERENAQLAKVRFSRVSTSRELVSETTEVFTTCVERKKERRESVTGLRCILL